MALNSASQAKLQKVRRFSALPSTIQSQRILLGLACAAVHKAEQTELVPPSFFAKPSGPSVLSSLRSNLRSRLSISRVTSVTLEEKRPNFAFLRRIRDHPRFTQAALGHVMEEENKYPAIVVNEGDTLIKLVNEWADEWLEDTHGDADVEKRLEGMAEEVVWGNVIWYGVGGWHARGDSGRTFNADFFVCVLSIPTGISILTVPNSVHLVTSAVFLLTVVLRSEQAPNPPVPLSSRLTLLKAYLATCAGWYISRGNVALPIKDFYDATSDRLTAPPAVPAPPDAERKPLSAEGGPWQRIITNTVAHPDEHLCKAIRSFSSFATRWGGRPAGYYAGGGEGGLEGREVLDGTLFVRAASLTLDRLGWAQESGKSLGHWDRDGFNESGDGKGVSSAYL
jgi:questin oxidase-like protein